MTPGMTPEKLNERPPRGLLSWGVSYEGEPQKGAYTAEVDVWLPTTVARRGIEAIANYLEPRLGWVVHRGGGWSSGSLMGTDELTIVGVKVRAREIKAALKAHSSGGSTT